MHILRLFACIKQLFAPNPDLIFTDKSIRSFRISRTQTQNNFTFKTKRDLGDVVTTHQIFRS